MAFDPDKFLSETTQPQKKAFNPDQFLAEIEQKPDRSLEAGIEGFGQAATLGYLPQLQAGAQKVVEFLTPESEVDKALKEQGFQIQEKPQSYTDIRDQYVQRGQQLQQEAPVASAIGQLAGGITSGLAMAPLTGGATAATMAGRVGQAAKTGAIMGGLYNPGEAEGDVSPLQIKDRLKNASFGAITGIMAQGGIEGVAKTAKAITKIPDSLKRYSEIKSFKASGAMLKDFKKQYGRKKVNDIGRSMIEHKIVALGDDITDIAKKAEVMRQKVGNDIGSIYQSADDIILKKGAPQGAQLDAKRLADEFLGEVKSRNSGKVGGRSLVDKVSTYLDEIADNGSDVTFQKWKQIRESIDDQINWAKINEPKPVHSELMKLRNKMQKIAQDKLGMLDDSFGGSRSKEILKLNKDYSNLADVAKMAQEKMAREEANAAFGLRERIQSGVGATVGGMVGGLPGAIVGGTIGGVATKAARQYGTPIVARSADKIGDILENNPQLLGKFAQPLIESLQQSPKEFAAVITNFMQDPEFKRKIEGKKKIKPMGSMR